MIPFLRALWTSSARRIVAGAVIAALGVFAGMAVNLKIKTLERDLFLCRTGVAEQALEAAGQIRAAESKAYQKARNDDKERNAASRDTERAIGEGGDDAAAPVLRDTARRLLERYRARPPADPD